mmetsp:Transcript_33671/g.82601  ORF Transcript_33671/g.82601 Transcript_33671/m.82601 type:complete len:207 (-) Transcript_33671:959-1579(-)
MPASPGNPATVKVRPVNTATERRQEFPVSATMSVPVDSISTMPVGPLKRALVSNASRCVIVSGSTSDPEKPCVGPATRVNTPVATSILPTPSAPASAKYAVLPSAVSARASKLAVPDAAATAVLRTAPGHVAQAVTAIECCVPAAVNRPAVASEPDRAYVSVGASSNTWCPVTVNVTLVVPGPIVAEDGEKTGSVLAFKPSASDAA